MRDAEGAERALVSAVRAGASPGELADMLFAAATDHRYLDGGHTLDFVNKALEALDVAGWERAEAVLASLPVAARRRRADGGGERVAQPGRPRRAARATRSPQLPDAVAAGARAEGGWDGRAALVDDVLEGEAAPVARRAARRAARGASEVELASAVSFAAATRIARFPTSNEFGDWDTALHTFTFANAVEQGLRRSPSVELLRGVFDAAASVHLDRFLNVPATRLPKPRPVDDPAALLGGAAEPARPAAAGRRGRHSWRRRSSAPAATARELVAALGAALVREDRNFHTIQCVEAAVRQHELLGAAPTTQHPAARGARYLAAHATTTRSQRQTFEIARRLHRGERLYEDELPPAA